MEEEEANKNEEEDEDRGSALPRETRMKFKQGVSLIQNCILIGLLTHIRINTFEKYA